MQSFQPPTGFRQPGPQSAPGEGGDVLASRSTMLLQRITDIERAIAVQEWWLLGHIVPEARLLAEVASLLAVARGELEHFLARFFGRPMPPSDAELTLPSAGPLPDANEHPEWVVASRDQAIDLLRMSAASLPSMRQFSQALRAHAERLGLPMAAVDALSVVSDRLGEAYEALQEPPS